MAQRDKTEITYKQCFIESASPGQNRDFIEKTPRLIDLSEAIHSVNLGFALLKVAQRSKTEITHEKCFAQIGAVAQNIDRTTEMLC